MNQLIDLSKYYTAAQAASVLSSNSGKTIKTSYIRTLAKYGVFHAVKVSDQLSLYPKDEVDAYVVEDRGVKGGRAKQAAKLKRLEEEEQDVRGAAEDRGEG